MPFWDISVTAEPERTFSITLYRKPTHTEQYLQWDSNHSLSTKYNVFNTVTHRARTDYANSLLLQIAEENIRGGPSMMQLFHLGSQQAPNKNNITPPTPITKTNLVTNEENNSHMMVLYTKGLGKSFMNICNQHGIKEYIKGSKTIKNLLVASKDKDTITQEGEVISRCTYNRVMCEEYIGESPRTFGE